MVSFSSREDALLHDWNISAYYQSLNGEWKFHYVEIPGKEPGNFFLPGFDDNKWLEIYSHPIPKYQPIKINC